MGETLWREDGWGWRARIGLLVPAADLGPESEFNAMTPPGVSIHATRVPFRAMAPGGAMDEAIPLAPVKAFGEPPFVDDAAELLSEAPVHAIAYGFTSSSYTGSAEQDRAMAARLRERARDVPVVVPGTAALRAIETLGAKHLALVSPPWFSDDLTKLGSEYFSQQGVDVVFAGSAQIPNGQRDFAPGALYEWVVANVPPSAGVVFMGGNGFRAIGVIETLERQLGIPVLTANQVLFWEALQEAGARVAVDGYGAIFTN
ncbi:MAG TPA: maleate cis-trans isomerase [Actinomycetota bacterium]|nr:maleate cis-trans isomerase [Actinomycetota bacterium]